MLLIASKIALSLAKQNRKTQLKIYGKRRRRRRRKENERKKRNKDRGKLSKACSEKKPQRNRQLQRNQKGYKRTEKKKVKKKERLTNRQTDKQNLHDRKRNANVEPLKLDHTVNPTTFSSIASLSDARLRVKLSTRHSYTTAFESTLYRET